MDKKPAYKELEQAVGKSEQKFLERAQTDEALKEFEIRYRRLFETARDGILILDAGTGQIADANHFLMEACPSLKVIVCSGYSIEGPAQVNQGSTFDY